MEKKIFYTLQQQKGVKGVRKECGYELEIATRKFYSYVSADQTVDLCQYFGHKKLNFSPSITYAERIIS